jgi:CrcB protein
LRGCRAEQMPFKLAVLLVFVGGAVGAVARELLMLLVPTLSHGFPLDILVANIVASFLIGLSTGRHNRKAINDRWHMMVTTGTAGGLSTFSSFVYASSVLMTASTTGALVALAYLLISLAAGYLAVIVGMKIGSSAQCDPTGNRRGSERHQKPPGDGRSDGGQRRGVASRDVRL